MRPAGNFLVWYNEKMSKKVLVFDMDGVLFDTIPYAEKTFLENHPGVTSEMYKELHSGNYHEEIKKYSHLRKEETEEERAERSLAYAEKKRETPMFEGIEDLLKDLHNSGYALVLNTNAFDRNCVPLLERSGIKYLFDLIASAEFSKSKVEKFGLIEEKYNVNKADMLFITDALGDVKEAEMAGVPTIAVTWGVHDDMFFNGEKHPNLVGVMRTVKELRDFLFQ
jgi:phosphoglycolate phosphatase